MSLYLLKIWMRCCCVLVFLLSCGLIPAKGGPPGQPVSPGPGVSRQLAVERAQNISDVRYGLYFEIPRSVEDAIPARLRLEFTLRRRSAVVLDFKAPAGHLRGLVMNGGEVGIDYRDGHIFLPVRNLRKGSNTVEIVFIAGELSLNRNRDYLYTLLVPDRASTAFPCFDQPDIKARYQLGLAIPADWEAVANGAPETVSVKDGRKEYLFRETQPFSTYLFAFAAGRFGKRTQERSGRAMTMYFRETDQAKVDKNADQIFDLHDQAIRWLEDYTAVPFPFEKLDFALLPGFQYGGMEHVGSIFYREPALFLDESATDNQKLARARLIAHETAHMWFGNLVTMRWFNDVWLKEVFANFMAAKAVNPAFPEIHHDLSFMLGHQPTAYGEDRSGGAHPIQQELENLQDAGSLYGGIIYQKAPVVMRQLEALIGEATFRAGIRQYLSDFAYKNATWDDLIGIFDALSPLEVASWSQVWVKEAGMPMLSTAWQEGDTLQILQEKRSKSGALWSQQAAIAFFYDDEVRTVSCRIEQETTKIPFPVDQGRPKAVLVNGSSMSYGYFRLDEQSRQYFLRETGRIADPLLRGAAWMALYEELLNNRVAPEELMGSVLEALAGEREPLNRQHLLGMLGTLYWRFLTPDQRQAIATPAESLLWRLLQEADGVAARAAYYAAFCRIVSTGGGIERLYAIWQGKEKIPGLPVSEAQMIDLAAELALRMPDRAEEVLSVQLGRTQNPDRVQRLKFLLPALSADEATRDTFFKSLQLPENRGVEPWVVDAMEYLNHPLRGRGAEGYILPSLELLEEIRRTGDIFFPRQFITAVLSGHQSAQAAGIVRGFLEKETAFPYRLRNKTLMAADLLFRVAR